MGAAFSGAILESKGNAYDFSEKLQKRPKNWKKKGTKYLKIWAKMYKIWKYFGKRQVIACDYRTQTARKCPAFLLVQRLQYRKVIRKVSIMGIGIGVFFITPTKILHLVFIKK